MKKYIIALVLVALVIPTFSFASGATAEEITAQIESLTRQIKALREQLRTRQPSITILSPNGGETFFQGSAYEYTWVSNRIGNEVKITTCMTPQSYERAGKYESRCSLSHPEPNTGSYKNTFGQAAILGEYTIKIEDSDNPSVYDESNAPFNIVTSSNKPDLTVFDIYEDGSKLSVKIGNVGNVSAPSNTGHLYIWIDGQLKWTYSLSTLYSQSFLLPGGMIVVQPQVLSGPHKIKAFIDPNNKIAESNEVNNTLEKNLTFRTAAVRLLVNGLSSPEPIPFSAPFIVSWKAPHNTRCSTYGMFVPTWSDQVVNWANMDDNGPLPPTGSVKLTATLLLNETTPTYHPALMLGMECIGKRNKTFKDEIIIPVLPPVSES